MDRTLLEAAGAFEGRSALITGGLGFLGSSLARTLVKAGARVTVVDALIPGHGGLRFNLAGIEDSVEVHIFDLREEQLLPELVRGRDVVFSLAGQTSHLDSMVDPFNDLEHNCRAPLAVLETCRREAPDAKVVFAGTRQIYGRPDSLPVDEDHPIRPVDINGVHKYTGESYHRLYRDVYGTRITVLRLTNTYGPRMRVRDARQTFLGLWIRLLLDGKEIEVYGDGSQRRDFNYVDDALRALLLVAVRPEADGQVFNLGNERAVSLRELAELLVAIHGRGRWSEVEFPPDRKAIDIGDYQGDFTRIRELLGWKPAVTLEEGLERSLAYFAEHGAQYWDPEEVAQDLADTR